MWRGANNGSRILRYFTWSGGSICSGISGRTEPIARASTVAADENTSGWRNASSAASLVVRMCPIPSSASTGPLSRSVRYIPCG